MITAQWLLFFCAALANTLCECCVTKRQIIILPFPKEENDVYQN